jgi:hypothetical protein
MIPLDLPLYPQTKFDHPETTSGKIEDIWNTIAAIFHLYESVSK